MLYVSQPATTPQPSTIPFPFSISNQSIPPRSSSYIKQTRNTHRQTDTERHADTNVWKGGGGGVCKKSERFGSRVVDELLFQPRSSHHPSMSYCNPISK